MLKDNQQLANASLAITRPEYINLAMLPTERVAHNQWRADVLERVDTAHLPEHIKNRIRARRAGVRASVAFNQTRRGEPANVAATRALEALAGVNKAELAEEDQSAYTETAIRVSAVRWGALAASSVSTMQKVAVTIVPGQSVQTCVVLTDAKSVNTEPVTVRCTYGIVSAQSASVNAAGAFVTLGVQPLDERRELWAFKLGVEGWTVDVPPHASSSPDLGYIEFAGWVPGATHFLTARETCVDGRMRKSFELVRLDSLMPRKKLKRHHHSARFIAGRTRLGKSRR